MDPLSITTGVVGLLGAAKVVVGEIYTVVNEPKQRAEFKAAFIFVNENLESFNGRLQYILQNVKETRVDGQSYLSEAKAQSIVANLKDLKANLDTSLEEAQPHRHGQQRLKYALDRATWSLKKKEFSDHLIEKLRPQIRNLRDILDDVGAIFNTDSHLKINRNLQDAKTAEILHWISPHPLDQPPISDHGKELVSEFVQTSFIYQRWHEAASWHLNCSGAPGTGKTVRAHSIFKDLQAKAAHSDAIVLSLFFRRNNDARQDTRSVVRSLLRQAIASRSSPEIEDDIRTEWSCARNSGSTSGPSFDLALQALRNCLPTKIERYLVVDALDDAGAFEKEVRKLIGQFRSEGVAVVSGERTSTRTHYDQVSCCKCSTPSLQLYYRCEQCIGLFGNPGFELCHPCFDRGLKCPGMHLLEPPKKVNIEVIGSPKEIQEYVRSFLKADAEDGDVGSDDPAMYGGNPTLLSSLLPRLERDFVATLPALISDAAGGNFQYAEMFLNRLKAQPNVDAIHQLQRQLTEGKLPDVNIMYGQELHSLLLEDPYDIRADEARSHLSMVAVAEKALTFKQLAHAVAILPKQASAKAPKLLEDFVDRITPMNIVRESTRNLLSCEASGDNESFPVFFCHYPLLVYIRDNVQTWFPNAEQKIFEACMLYLGLEVFSHPFPTRQELDKRLREYPFAAYATLWWGHHAAKQVELKRDYILRILRLLRDHERLNCVMQIAWYTPEPASVTWDVPSGVTPLQVLAFHGLKDLCQLLLHNGALADAREPTYDQTALIYACRRGHSEVVTALLDAGADPNHLTRLHKSPVIEAIEQGHKNVLDILLTSNKIQLNVISSSSSALTALTAAVKFDRTDMLESLLGHAKLDVNMLDGAGTSALVRAVQMYNLKCAQLLLADRRTLLNTADATASRTAIDWTAEPGTDFATNSAVLLEIARLLVSHDRRCFPSNSAIRYAIEANRPRLLTLFFGHGVPLDTDWRDANGGGFLHVSAFHGYLPIVEDIFNRLSRQPGFDLNMTDSHGASALHWTCREVTDRHIPVLEFLFSKGANPHLQDDKNSTAWQVAQKANPDLWASHIKDVFQSHNVNTIQGPPPSERPTLLPRISSNDFESAKAFLRTSSGALDSETDPYTLKTILHRAMNWESDKDCAALLKILLPRSATFLNYADSQGRTCAFYGLLSEKPLSVACLLREQGLDLNLRDHAGRTMLQFAIYLGKRYPDCKYLWVTCVDLIKEQRVVLPPTEEICSEVLRTAVGATELSVVKRLVEAGIDVGQRDAATGHTALQQAQKAYENAEDDRKKYLLKHPPKSQAEWKRQFYNEEMVKRKDMVQYLEEVSRFTYPVIPEDPALSRLIQSVEGMQPEQNAGDLVGRLRREKAAIQDGSTQPLTGIGKPHATSKFQHTVHTVMQNARRKAPVPVSLLSGREVVSIVITVTVGIVAIVWILMRR